jgi:aminopeptidase N
MRRRGNVRARFMIATAVAGAVGCGDAAPGAPPDAGVPFELSVTRARSITDLSYQLEFVIPDARQEPILGEVQIMFEWAGDGSLALDFAAGVDQVQNLVANGEVVAPGPVNEHLLIPRSALRKGSNVIRVSFVAGDGSLNRADEFLYTLFVPDRARWAFPVFDQPDLKARFSLSLDLPPDWVAVANGAELEVTGVSRPPAGDRVIYRFQETEPISTYLFAFAAGRFEVEEAERDGRTMRLYHRESDRSKVDRNLDAIFDLHATALEWLEDYTAIEYPFGKFDFVAVPSFQYGGMEHPGAIFYNASSMFLDESATQGQLLGRASVIAHETAHMWFGDLVTMRWFDDVWMKEVFANFMAAKIVNPSFPELDHDLRFLLAHYPAAYAVDRTAGANPIRQPLDNLAEAGTLYGAIIYQKAPIVMRHLETLIGEETFRDGLRDYLDTHRFSNATWADLIGILDPLSPADLRAWSEAWVEEPGRPTVTTTISADEAGGRGTGITFSQTDPRGRGLEWEQPLSVWLGDGHPTLMDVALDGPVATIATDRSFDAVLPNGDGVGYALFRQTPDSRRWLVEHISEIREPVPRAVAWLTLWDELLERAVRPDEWMSMAVSSIATEDEELLLSRVLADVETAYWRFLDDEARETVGPELEVLLWDRLTGASTTSLKASFFNAYVAVARSPEAMRRLEAVWRAGGGVEGLPLAERDLTRLAGALAVREVAGWDSILDLQAARITNPDRRAEFDFIRPALSADPNVRDAFFASLSEAENREREPWVLAALGWLHHPIRADGARGYLRPSLDLLEEVQRTGDIFFPQRWLGASLGGHATPEAADIVRDFLTERPDLPPRLQAKLLQSADMLFRAATFRDPDIGN